LLFWNRKPISIHLLDVPPGSEPGQEVSEEMDRNVLFGFESRSSIGSERIWRPMSSPLFQKQSLETETKGSSGRGSATKELKECRHARGRTIAFLL